MRMVTLRTGAEVPVPALSITRISLDELMEQDPVALVELVELARNPGYTVFSDNVTKALSDAGLLNSAGRLDNVTRDIVLASVEGDGLDIRLLPRTAVLARGETP